MAFESEKPHLEANSLSSPFLQDGKTSPLNQEEPVDEDGLERRLTRAQTIDKQIKHRVRVLRAIQRCISAMVSVFVLGVMVNTYFVFTTHKTASISGTTIQVYPKKPLLWPTYMMLATSIVSLVFDLAVLFAYCISMCKQTVKDKVTGANTVDNWNSRVGYVVSGVNFVVWLSTSTTFKMMQGAPDSNPPPNDLFGFSCSTFTDELKAKYNSAVPNFDIQCKTQLGSFGLGVIKAFLELLSLTVTIYSVRRLIQKKKVARLESRSSSAKLGKTF